MNSHTISLPEEGHESKVCVQKDADIETSILEKPPVESGLSTYDIAPVNFDNIPALLQQHKHWVLWRLVQRDGKSTKVPYHSNGQKADVTDVSACETYETVKACYEANYEANGSGELRFDGVGFVLTKEIGVIGVDIDGQKCENGLWKPTVDEQIAALQTYGEISPSGRGVRFFGIGALTAAGRKRGEFEIYDGDRYLTVTGHKLLGATDDVRECAQALSDFQSKYIARPKESADGGAFVTASRPVISNSLTDDELLQKARDSRKGARFTALWAGDLAHPDLASYNQDHSVADLALCNQLAFWTGRDPRPHRPLISPIGFDARQVGRAPFQRRAHLRPDDDRACY